MKQEDLKIAWNDSLVLGIEVIDLQHHRFVDLLNELYNAFQNMSSKEQCRPIIDGLLDYANYHFKTEEELFTKAGWEHAENHKKIHQALNKQLENYAEKFYAGGSIELINFLDFLEDWLIDHITVQDKQYAPIVKSKIK